MNTRIAGWVILFLAVGVCPCLAQLNDKPAVSPNGIRLGDPVVQRWQVGAVVQAPNGPVQNLLITIPVPTDWPEQTVKVIDENLSPNIGQVGYRIVDGAVKQMMVGVPAIPPGGSSCRADV